MCGAVGIRAVICGLHAGLWGYRMGLASWQAGGLAGAWSGVGWPGAEGGTWARRGRLAAGVAAGQLCDDRRCFCTACCRAEVQRRHRIIASHRWLAHCTTAPLHHCIALAACCSQVGGSIPERANGGRLYNTCLVYGRDGRLLGRHRKVHAGNGGVGS